MKFGHQENNSNDELLDILHHIRPGNNFQPLMDIFQKVGISFFWKDLSLFSFKINVNGRNEDPLFTFLKKTLPTPHDNQVWFFF